MCRKSTKQEFVEKCNKIHNNFYNYDKSEYKGRHYKIIITCPIHGNFEQEASSHLKGCGCSLCAFERISTNMTKNSDNFFQEVKLIHPTLDFSKSVYRNSDIKVSYTCFEHGLKESLPSSLLEGSGCLQCGHKKIGVKNSLGRNNWVTRFQKKSWDHIDYSLLPDSFGCLDKLTFVCKIHGKFQQSANDHCKADFGCPTCGLSNNINSGWTCTNWETAAKISDSFDSFKIYIIRCWNKETGEEFYKIGRTYCTVKRRFSTFPYNWEVISIFESKDARKIFDLETQVKRNYKDFKYIPKLKFNGMQECFSQIDITQLQLTNVD